MSENSNTAETPAIEKADERLTSRALFCALETMIRQRTPEGFFPLPYVWYHHSQKNWWLSTERGSMAVGTFEQAVSALSISQNAGAVTPGEKGQANE
jgi:hypothetical protein